MSYTLVSVNGPGDHIASVQGMADLIAFLDNLRVWGPLKDFLAEGETSQIPEVLRDITMYVPLATNQDVKKTLLTLKSALEKVNGWAAIGE